MKLLLPFFILCSFFGHEIAAKPWEKTRTEILQERLTASPDRAWIRRSAKEIGINSPRTSAEMLYSGLLEASEQLPSQALRAWFVRTTRDMVAKSPLLKLDVLMDALITVGVYVPGSQFRLLQDKTKGLPFPTVASQFQTLKILARYWSQPENIEWSLRKAKDILVRAQERKLISESLVPLLLKNILERNFLDDKTERDLFLARVEEGLARSVLRIEGVC